MRLWKLNVK